MAARGTHRDDRLRSVHAMAAIDSVPAEVRDQVAARRPVDERERDSISAFLAAFDALDRPFDEEADPTHVTASAIVVGARGVVLHRHKRLGMWLQPGGHVDDGEEPPAAALREAREETGLPVSLAGRAVAHVDVHAGPRGHTHLDLRYLVHADPVDPAPPEGESQDVRWFSWADAIGVADVGLEGVLRARQPGEPVLRRAAAGDAAAIAHVHLRSRRFATPEIPNVHDEADVVEWVAGRIIGRVERDANPADEMWADEVWVADVDGVVVAEMILSHAWSPAFLDHLYLDPSWLGRGLGDRMLALAAARCPSGLQLWTHQGNGAARRFYERRGFTAAETTDGASNEERLPDVRYVRE
jgi:8-oxo-dGTP pyrophosphatase MutT (NUDIX family)/N-acetylglutamate synthase-like GNAT family acetyltransferase